METDIRAFINGIKNKTGIDLAVYDSDGNFIAGQSNFPKDVNNDFEDLYQDEENQLTLFSIKYKNKSFIGCLSGCSETERN
ncbi:MAG: hypothetical protein IJX16_04020, partial [Clostridia bacterium]|nr:hypothetical protein [Clostridia bacterium]